MSSSAKVTPEQLVGLLQDRLSPDDNRSVLSAIQSDPELLAELNELRDVGAALDSLRTIEIAEHSSIAADVLIQTQPPPNRMIAYWAGAAASLCCMLLVLLSWHQGDSLQGPGVLSPGGGLSPGAVLSPGEVLGGVTAWDRGGAEVAGRISRTEALKVNAGRILKSPLMVCLGVSAICLLAYGLIRSNRNFRIAAELLLLLLLTDLLLVL